MAMTRTDFEQVLMGRDGISLLEAKKKRAEAQVAVLEIVENGGSFDEVEDLLLSEYGLEMDYIMDLL